MSTPLAVGALLMLLALVTNHARKMAKGKLAEREIWKDTGDMGLIMFWTLIVLISVDLFLMWRAS